jgi:MoxR-like ATPase
VARQAEIVEAQALAHQIFVEDTVLEFILKIVAATRTEAEFKAGISVRGGLALRQGAQARALLHGRDFVVPEDVHHLVLPVFAHRLSSLRPSSDAREERQAVVTALKRIVAAIPTPV